MRILVLQHLSVEHPGVFRELWTSEGHSWLSVELDEGELIPPLDSFDLLVAMGGPMDVWQEDLHPWLVQEKAAIRRWVCDMRRPFLGICLGHQLLAAALGGEVSLMPNSEVGLVDVSLTLAGRSDPLLAGFNPTVETFQWHSAEVSRLPAQANVLASNAACRVQAMRYADNAYGFQYHIEIEPTTVSEWSAIPEYRASLQAALGPEKADRLDVMVSQRLTHFRETAQRLNNNLMALVERR